MMIRNILALTFNDLAIALKNKTIYLVLFIPFFVFVSLNLIDRTDIKISKLDIGLIQNYAYAPQVMDSLKAAGEVIAITWVQNEEEGRRLLKEKKLDGVLLGNAQEPGTLALLVSKKESILTLAIVESFAALQKAAEGGSANWITDIKTLHSGGIQIQTLSTWILMLVLLVGFIILPAQVAEEKEKNLLLALLQTPIREVQWLIAKVITGMVLSMIAIFFLHLLGEFGIVNLFDYIILIATGSFCFSAFGVFLGFLCRSQASARTLGVLFYLPMLLPSALSDFSEKLTTVAPLLPSYYFYAPLQAILLEDGKIANMSFELIYLLLVGSITFYFSWFLMKKRWLM
jgi:ABC-2 type transport system permease protein